MDFLNSVISFFNQTLDFLYNQLYGFVTAAFAQYVIYATVAMIKFKLAMISFAWDVAQEIISQLNLSSYVNAAFGALDDDLLGFICFFRVPEFCNTIMSAYITRYVMTFIGV
ncbi:DUF2523 family protein [Methylovulum miyakonense]|uniref:DUF2523 family protein n=1 Tax=Methylovulum miyakonense TaxID=645578 RepID=UPI000366622D|nr:DUF2523 family protein [Methylovulum miyakonense]